MKCYERLKAAARCAVPLVTIETGDPSATVEQIRATLVFGDRESPIIEWDRVRGVRAINEPGQRAVACIDSPEFQLHPAEFLKAVYAAADENGRSLPESTVVIVHGGHTLLEEPGDIQAIWNLRDRFKYPARMLILLGPGFNVPSELQHDLIQLVEPLPDAEQLAGMVSEVCKAAELEIDETAVQAAASASLGMTMFAAENLTAMALSPQGLNLDGLWESKRKKINETPGLKVVPGGQTLDDLGGIEQAKRFFSAILRGNDPPRLIVYIDEADKAFAANKTDTSGVAQDQLGQILTDMQDNNATGSIFFGPPGAAKSALAKALGHTFGIMTVQIDMGGAKGSLVGESERKIRDALKVINAVSDGKTLWLATCNSMAVLPPELRRRFRLGTFFFDLPDREERQKIWEIYARKHERSPGEYTSLIEKEWTGAEIESCFDVAWRTSLTLVEASDYIIPVATHSRELIEGLRSGANSRFLSASYPGPYRIEGKSESKQPIAKSRRQFRGNNGDDVAL